MCRAITLCFSHRCLALAWQRTGIVAVNGRGSKGKPGGNENVKMLPIHIFQYPMTPSIGNWLLDIGYFHISTFDNTSPCLRLSTISVLSAAGIPSLLRPMRQIT